MPLSIMDEIELCVPLLQYKDTDYSNITQDILCNLVYYLFCDLCHTGSEIGLFYQVNGFRIGTSGGQGIGRNKLGIGYMRRDAYGSSVADLFQDRSRNGSLKCGDLIGVADLR